MRSRFGVGMTPPKVLGTPYPWSSVMMSRTFGAPLGGTMRGGHHGVESLALSLITPPNFGGGGGICFPSIVVVALGEPNSPVTCCATAGAAASRAANTDTTTLSTTARFGSRFMLCAPDLICHTLLHGNICHAQNGKAATLDYHSGHYARPFHRPKKTPNPTAISTTPAIKPTNCGNRAL